MTTVTTSSAGAATVSSWGQMAQPLPKTFPENTGSGTSDIAMALPATGALRTGSCIV